VFDFELSMAPLAAGVAGVLDAKFPMATPEVFNLEKKTTTTQFN
jgi:hypothetical protein